MALDSLTLASPPHRENTNVWIILFLFTFMQKALGDIHVVLCNESSDLDSVVSSIVTGYYIAHSICKEEKVIKLHYLCKGPSVYATQLSNYRNNSKNGFVTGE